MIVIIITHLYIYQQQNKHYPYDPAHTQQLQQVLLVIII